MAYTFDQINSVLGQQAAGGSGNADIFGQGNGANGSQQGQSDQNQAGSSGTQKTSTDGELSAGSAGSSGVANTQPKQTNTQTSGQAILDKAKQANIDTGFTNKIVGDVKQGESTLQNEANAYTQAQAGKSAQNLGASDIEAGLSGDAGQQSKLNSLLHGTSANADQFQSGVTNQFQDIDQIGTQGGLQAYLKNRGNENYTEGQAALDSLLFSRDKNFQQGVQAAKQERNNLDQQKQNYESTLQGQAQQQLDAAQNSAKSGASNYLTGQQTAEQNLINSRLAAENAKRSEVHDNIQRYTDAEAADVVDPLAKANPGDAAIYQQARQNIVDNPYMHDQYQAAGAGDVLNGQEASRFNNILQLLGQGGTPVQTGPGNYGTGYNFDRKGYTDALMAEVNRLKNLPPPTVSASGGVKESTGGFNPFSSINTAVQTEKEHPGETLATGGLNIPVRAGAKEIKKLFK